MIDVMLFFFGTLMDNIVVTCSDRIRTGDRECVEVHFEQPVSGGFNSARYVLPDHRWLFIEGYSADEIRCFEEYIKQNEDVLWHWGCSPLARRMQNDLYPNDERSDEALL